MSEPPLPNGSVSTAGAASLTANNTGEASLESGAGTFIFTNDSIMMSNQMDAGMPLSPIYSQVQYDPSPQHSNEHRSGSSSTPNDGLGRLDASVPLNDWEIRPEGRRA